MEIRVESAAKLPVAVLSRRSPRLIGRRLKHTGDTSWCRCASSFHILHHAWGASVWPLPEGALRQHHWWHLAVIAKSIGGLSITLCGLQCDIKGVLRALSRLVLSGPERRIDWSDFSNEVCRDEYCMKELPVISFEIPNGGMKLNSACGLRTGPKGKVFTAFRKAGGTREVGRDYRSKRAGPPTIRTSAHTLPRHRCVEYVERVKQRGTCVFLLCCMAALHSCLRCCVSVCLQWAFQWDIFLHRCLVM